MQLSALDVGIIVAFLLSVIIVGSAAAKRASKSSADFFLSGRTMPWWLLGVSMVACTFSADTPNLVTDIVRTGGIAGNWAWWAFLLTGMLTVFVYAKLWRRSALDTARPRRRPAWICGQVGATDMKETCTRPATRSISESASPR